MKKYMLVIRTDEYTQVVQFYDEYINAGEGCYICLAVGWFSELYEYTQETGYTKIM